MAENSKDDPGQKKGHHEEDSELNRWGGHENASPNRGSTTDMGESALTVDRDDKTRRGSGITTKNTVAGSDFDGQLSD